MAIQVNCQCGRTCNFPDPHAGQKARCMYCGQMLDVPALDGGPAQPGGADLSLEMSQPSSHAHAQAQEPKAPVARPQSKPAEPVHRQAAGLGVGKMVFWGVIASVLGVIVFGVYSLVHWWNMSEYESYIHGGKDWLAKGYLTDAEINFKKAKALFPNDPRTEEVFTELAREREDRLRNPRPVNAVLGPIAAPSMIPADAQQRFMMAQQQAAQAQAMQQNRRREMEERIRAMEDPRIPVAVPKPPQGTLLNPPTVEKKDLSAAQAEAAAKRAEAEAKRVEALRLAAEERERKIAEAKELAEKRKQEYEAASKAREEERQQRATQVVLGQLTSWSTNAVQEAARSAAVEPPWGSTRITDSLAVAAKRAIDDMNAEEVSVKPPAILQKIGDLQDGPGLTEFYKSLPSLIQQAEEAEVAGRGAKAVARNQIITTLRAYDRVVQQETPLKSQYGADAMKKRDQLTAEKQKLGEKLSDQCEAYLKGLNECRAAKAGKEMLLEAKKLTAAQLQTLGVDLAASGAAGTSGAPPAVVKHKVYVLKDGTEINAVTVISTGDQLLIKDDAGAMRTVLQADVKEIRK